MEQNELNEKAKELYDLGICRSYGEGRRLVLQGAFEKLKERSLGIKGYTGEIKPFGRKLTEVEKLKIRSNSSGYICAEGCGSDSMEKCEWNKEGNCPY